MGNIKKGSKTLPPKTHKLDVLSKMTKTKLFLNFQIVQEVPRIIFTNNCQRQFLVKQINKLENSNWFNTNSNFETKLRFPKIQNKIMGSSINILWASINIFVIY